MLIRMSAKPLVQIALVTPKAGIRSRLDSLRFSNHVLDHGKGLPVTQIQEKHPGIDIVLTLTAPAAAILLLIL